MARQRSAGVLLYRHGPGGVEVLLVHPGGPYWRKRDAGAWSIPKGEIDEGEDARAAAWREFGEELGSPVPDGPAIDLGAVRQRSGKQVTAWAVEGDLDPEEIESATFTLEWPPRSGQERTFPEVDRAGWFALEAAHEKLLEAQRPLLDRLVAALDGDGGADR
ncbi:MAG TPA: NUDIX domain-containing protein [Capillimicrobium sp.]|nr:NUDIX domain-containing protein [Capillimicrobium sp.]